MRAVILSIGDELALGQTVDTNSAYLAAKLTELGIGALYHQTLADDRAVVSAAIVQAAQQATVVLVTGGLGPTEDDLTRQALAKAMGTELVEDPASLAQIKHFFADWGRPMPDCNKVQALHPTGSNMIENPLGTAPGIRAVLGKATVYVMPGVPREMRAMFERSILSEMRTAAGPGPVILSTKINTFGAGESTVAQLLEGLMGRHQNPLVGTTVTGGIVSVRIRSESRDPKEAKTNLDKMADKVESLLSAIVFGRDDQTLQASVVDELRRSGLTAATAESCTGGLIGKMLTDVPGASDVYAGGWVTYTNQMKQDQLGVSAQMLEKHGAVSGQTVCAMADRALAQSGANLAVSVSGVAGPDGGTPDKPVGTVWLALASQAKGSQTIETQAVRVNLPGGREIVRIRAALCALQLIRMHLLQRPITDMSWVTQTHPAA